MVCAVVKPESAVVLEPVTSFSKFEVCEYLGLALKTHLSARKTNFGLWASQRRILVEWRDPYIDSFLLSWFN